MKPAMAMKRALNVGVTSSKMLWRPGSWTTAQTAVPTSSGAFAAIWVAHHEPKLTPVTPSRSGSISGCARSTSSAASPASIMFVADTNAPSSSASPWPGPSKTRRAMPRSR